MTIIIGVDDGTLRYRGSQTLTFAAQKHELGRQRCSSYFRVQKELHRLFDIEVPADVRHHCCIASAASDVLNK